MCPLVLQLKSMPGIQVVTCVTGQHQQMLASVLDCFGIVPEYDLKIMKAGQSLFDITESILVHIRDVITAEHPDVVLVHGDTSTTFAAALACFYLQVPVGHVEAGLRTYDMDSPFPEEFNRQAVDLFARYHFAPTKAAENNLLKEGKSPDTIYVTGNTAIDALHTTIRANYKHPLLDWAQGSRLILLTAHRRENLGQPMRNMFRAIRRIVDETPDIKVIYPVHMNPRVLEIANKEFEGTERVRLINPLDVVDFHNFMAHSKLILTDSGGIQEEAPSLGKPVLVMRTTTERPEGVEAGTLRLVGTQEEPIYAAIHELLNNEEVYQAMSQAANPYGDGHASERIAHVLLNN